MKQFADEAIIEVSSGKGGNGCISFRREKYVPMGGPNGGDGGKGGDVIFRVRRNLRTLSELRFRRFFKAKNGGDGMGWNRYGKDGEDIVIEVPPGTAIRDVETRELIREFTTESEDESFVFLKGGNGGWGNVHFKTSTNQAPRIANAGKPGEYRKLLLELSIMADIGLVGFPNAGKSTLLDAFTKARPKIAPYPFTTKIPNLGVLHANEDRDVIIADIPGIIDFHDLHIWSISTTETALTVHLVRSSIPLTPQAETKLLGDIIHTLHQRFGIAHSTVQIETQDYAAFCHHTYTHTV